ncbi:MAG: Clp protease N-terminal domain-containing protein, partial [Deltaproteobacteria bacterium]
MRIDRFTTKAREALADAQSEAARRGNPEVVPEHVLLALLRQDRGIAPALVQKAGVEPRDITGDLERALEKFARVQGGSEPTLSRRTRDLLQKSEDEAKALKDDFVSVEHVVLAGLKHDREVTALFKKHGVDEAKLMGALREVRGSQRVSSEDPEATFQSLEKYARDLTDAARRGKLDPVIGRDNEIRRVMQVLSRRTKNNP